MGRTAFKFISDLLLWSAAAPLAFMLRLEDPWPRYTQVALVYALAGLPIKAVLEASFALHLQVWRRMGIRDLYSLAKAVFFGTVLLSAVAFFLHLDQPIPRSVPLIEGGLALLLLGGVRLAGRMLFERAQLAQSHLRHRSPKRVLIVGAGEAGTMLAREMLRHPESGLVPVGFLDDDPGKQRQRFVGLPVIGRIEDLPRVAPKARADEVLIAIPSAPGKVVRRVVELARGAGLRHRIVPGIYEILSGKVAISQIRNVDVEDLLRRNPVQLDTSEISGYLEGRVVLVTGAGGSIGSEIVRQVARFRPRRILLLGRGENSLYQIERELERTWPELDWRTIVADVRDREKMRHVFTAYAPEVVFHAAAHKHVPMMEANPDEAVFNNVGGTKNVVGLALEHGVVRFVNISTDKAVNPTSVMGASKRVAEYLVQWAAQRAKPGQAFVSVRFGNVLGSRGSVIPLFKEQIASGGPVTVTHPEMTRYFMTIPEAAQLVLQAGGLGNNGSVYVLDMGEPVKIVDLAKDLIRLSGFQPDEDISIVFTGMRPGEKLFEELLTAEEGTEATKHEKIFVARTHGMPEEALSHLVKALFDAAVARDVERIQGAFRELIPTYEPKGFEA
ncbi:polysaccharide biosynthesis protein [Oceanithermus desulfurans]|nr:nucleoside-diphosphate sugar epimerase/dehydratase [Oceanithermus desulfurans]MBB6030473.1 FlaA1/EpsC-like NDP-sugar epimerase [Oceanithermus desulfurans]